MELPQSRPLGTEGGKSALDFLSLYLPVQKDRRPSQGGQLKTHDFLQPLEQGKNIAKEENKVETTAVEKTPSPAPLTPSAEHLLPGGIGTYSITHISYINQRVPNPEGAMFQTSQASSDDRKDENSNCSSYSGSGFTLWEESVVKEGKTRKENIAEDRQIIGEIGGKIGVGHWTSSLERPSQSSSNHDHRSATFSSISSSRPSSARKNQSFMDMIKSAQSAQKNEDDDDDEEFVIKKEPSSHHIGNLSVKVDGKSTDQKPSTPRSKHSATEQRRRSKINDRFQMLRELIPHNDQKRDKASFLLEVIEYIQFLQEKVNKYGESYQGWNHEPPKLMPWQDSDRPTEGFVDNSWGTNCESGPSVFSARFEENIINLSPPIPRNGQNLVESGMSTANAFKEMDHHPGLINKASPLPVRLQPNIFSPGGSSSAAAPLPHRLESDTENKASQPQSQLWQRRSRASVTDCTFASDKLKDQELTIESGKISISSVYSEGLLKTLTQALQSSGLDLSKASISVQIDLGKQANCPLNSSTSIVKNDNVPSSNQAMARSRLKSTGEECKQSLKRLKTGRS